MFLVGMISWWYQKGLINRATMIISRIRSTLDLFSVNLLLNTLFSPYKQIAAEHIDGSLEDKMRSFFDRLVSRLIGAVVRLFMITAGLIVVLLQTIFGVVVLVGWLILPLVPLLGLVLWIIDWMPR